MEKNYKIRGYTKYDDSDIKHESSKYDITFALKDSNGNFFGQDPYKISFLK